MSERMGPLEQGNPHDTTTHMGRLMRPHRPVHPHTSILPVLESSLPRDMRVYTIKFGSLAETTPKKKRRLPRPFRNLATAVAIALSAATMPGCGVVPLNAQDAITLYAGDTIPDRLPEPLSSEYFPIGWDSEYGPVPKFHTEPDPKSPTISFEQFLKSYKPPSNSFFILARLYAGRAHEPDGTLTSSLSENAWMQIYKDAGLEVKNHNIIGKDGKVRGIYLGLEIVLQNSRTIVHVDPRLTFPISPENS